MISITDIPSRGMTASELSRIHLWLSDPDCLNRCQDLPDEDSKVSEECPQEMKSMKTASQGHGLHLGQLISYEKFSSLHRLLWVTALVLKFVYLHLQVRKLSALAPTDRLIGINHARPYWLRDRCSISAASFLCGSIFQQVSIVEAWWQDAYGQFRYSLFNSKFSTFGQRSPVDGTNYTIYNEKIFFRRSFFLYM